MKTLTLGRQPLTYNELLDFYRSHESYQLALDDSIWPAVDASADCVAQVLADGKTVYGINTGFGLLASQKIPHSDLQELQRSLVVSHACGVGEPLSNDVVALIMLVKLKSLTHGYSGIRRVVIERLQYLLNQKIYPVIPAKGSVGASGDLAPLAHMACVLIGEGSVSYQGKLMATQELYRELDIQPLSLAAKEGLALLNGTNVSTALALKGLFAAESALLHAVVSGSMTVDAALGSYVPFDKRIHQIRGHQGQIDVAGLYRELLSRSEINSSHTNCDRVQDPYSLRCQPQVMGAILDQIRFAANTIITEANAVSDNPLVFQQDGDILSGGNFHAEPIAMASDNLAIALCEIGSMSERRISLLLDKHLSNLPPFLVDNSGVNSGFMIAQVTAAALASENKTYAHPASVDSIPTSANQEDHVSMATFAARRLTDIADNVAAIIAIELLCAAQGIDFRAPLNTSSKLQIAMRELRNIVPFYDCDRYMADDIESAKNLILTNDLISKLGLTDRVLAN